LLISNHNSFRVLFDKIVSVYFIWKKYIYTLAFDIASPGNQHCANCIGTLSFAIVGSVTAHGTHRRSAQECYSPATGRCDRWKVLAESSRTAALTQRHAVTDRQTAIQARRRWADCHIRKSSNRLNHSPHAARPHWPRPRTRDAQIIYFLTVSISLRAVAQHCLSDS